MAEPSVQEKMLMEKALSIANWSQAELLHPKNAAGWKFDDIKPVFDSLQEFYRQVSQSKFGWLPGNILDEMTSAANEVVQALVQVRDFNFQSFDPQNQRNTTAGRVSQQWREAVRVTAPYIALGHVTSGAVSQQMGELKKWSEGLGEELRKSTNDLTGEVRKVIENYATKVTALEQSNTSQRDELEKAIVAAREAAKFQAVTAQSQAFDDEANEARTASRWWMAGTIVSAIASLAFIWIVFLYNLHPAVTANRPTTTQSTATITNQTVSVAANPAPANEVSIESKTITASLLQQTIARVLIVTVLYSVLVWCARNYFASRHNFTVNRHRRNAMNTFRAFVEGTKDPATQDFILRQAAACAFSPQQSGYLKDESLPTPGPASQLVEMIKPGGKAE